MTARRRSGRVSRGVTLIEMMMALVTFLIFVGAVYGTYRAAQQARESTEERTDGYQTARVLLGQMNRELASAYHSASAVNSTLIGENADEGSGGPLSDAIGFLTVAPRLTPGTGPAGDVRHVRYSIGYDENDLPLGLMLEENRYPLTAVEETEIEPVLLSDLVIGLNCEYLDGETGEWVEAWTEQTVLPAAVRVELLLRPPRSSANPMVLSTSATLTMPAEGGRQVAGGGPAGEGAQPEDEGGVPSGGGTAPTGGGGAPTGGGGAPTGGGGTGGRYGP